MDSTAVAGTAQAVALRSGGSHDLHAFVQVYDRLIPDVERSWSTAAAEGMGLPLTPFVVDDYEQYAAWRDGRYQPQEPAADRLPDVAVDLARLTSAHSRVVLTGLGGDVMFTPEPRYLLGEAARLRGRRLLREVVGYRADHGRWPPLYLRSTLLRRLGIAREWSPPVPRWVSPSLWRELDLSARWEEGNRLPSSTHPLRPAAESQLRWRRWAYWIEEYGGSSPEVAQEYRHPFFDLRVLRFILRVPPVPWCVNKSLLRQAMAGRVPDFIRSRPKMLLAGRPKHAIADGCGATWAQDLLGTPGLERYVDIAALHAALGRGPQALAQADDDDVATVLGLSRWLKYHEP